jgi:hypothetical protein
MLLAQDSFFLLVRETGLLRFVGVGNGPFPDATAAHKYLCLENKLVLPGLALHVVDSVTVLHVSVETKDHEDFLHPPLQGFREDSVSYQRVRPLA